MYLQVTKLNAMNFSAVKRANYVINFRVLESEPVIPHLSRGFHKDVTDVAIIWGHVFFFFFFENTSCKTIMF